MRLPPQCGNHPKSNQDSQTTLHESVSFDQSTNNWIMHKSVQRCIDLCETSYNFGQILDGFHTRNYREGTHVEGRPTSEPIGHWKVMEKKP